VFELRPWQTSSVTSPNKTDALRHTSKDEAWKIANGIAKLPELLDFVRR
jgi:hypothetical protein